jgi:glutaminase
MKMPCQTNDELKNFLEEVKKFTKDGKVATYIPELGKANPVI